MTNLYDGRVATFMEQLVNGETNLVWFRTLIETHTFLVRQGFQLSWKNEYGPKGGRLLFYHGGGFRGSGKGMIVRIKTHGESKGKPRAFRPHLSVTWQEGVSNLGQETLDYTDHEKGKFASSGALDSKAPPLGSVADKESWANRTHPLFPGFESSSEINPMGLYGAETLPESGATA